MTNTARQFYLKPLAQRGPEPVARIIEIPADYVSKGGITILTRADAWRRAQQNVTPCVVGINRHPAGRIEFQGLDGQIAVVQTAAQTKAIFEDQRAEAKAAKAEPVKPAAAKATEKQVAFIQKLAAERVLPEGTQEIVLRAATLSVKEAKIVIEAALAAPKKATPAATTGHSAIPSGSYAIDKDGTLRFYKVRQGGPSRNGGRDWTGFVFVDVQAGDDFHAIRNRDERNRILDAIAVNPLDAAKRYGHEIGCCGVCHRTLTDPASIEAGIGPVCAEKF